MTRAPAAEWLDLKALQQYACVSERTLRDRIRRPFQDALALMACRQPCRLARRARSPQLK